MVFHQYLFRLVLINWLMLNVVLPWALVMSSNALTSPLKRHEVLCKKY